MVRDVVIPLTPRDAIYLHEIFSKVCGCCNLYRKLSGETGTSNVYKKFYNDCDLQDTCWIYQKYVVPLGEIMVKSDDVVYLTLSQHSASLFVVVLSNFCFCNCYGKLEGKCDNCLLRNTIECVANSLEECENNG